MEINDLQKLAGQVEINGQKSDLQEKIEFTHSVNRVRCSRLDVQYFSGTLIKTKMEN